MFIKCNLLNRGKEINWNPSAFLDLFVLFLKKLNHFHSVNENGLKRKKKQLYNETVKLLIQTEGFDLFGTQNNK